MRSLLHVAAASLVVAACAPPMLALPAGASCTKTVSAGPTVASVTEALAAAERGTCVVAAAGKYPSSFTVPTGVTFGAETGAPVEVSGDRLTSAAVTLGEGATLTGITVVNAPGVGVTGVGAAAHLLNVTVRGAKKVGVVFWCEEDCLTANPTELRDVALSGNAEGLFVHGARVSTVGGSITDSEGTDLATGYGVVASAGAELQMNGTSVEGNQELGVLVDGAQETKATLEHVTVKDNRGRGVWAQGLTGSMGAPKLQLTSCTLEGNRLAGLGARGSTGVRVEGGRIASTVLAQTTSSIAGVLVNVGDGVGLFEGSGDVLVDGVTLEGNERSQVLVDQGTAGVTVQGSTVTAQSGQLGVVVQNTTATVQAPMVTFPMAGQELPVSAPTLRVPTK